MFKPVCQPVQIIGKGLECPDRLRITIRADGRNMDGGANIDRRRRWMNPGQIP